MKKKVLAITLATVLALSLGLVMAVPAGADPGPGIVGLWHLDGNANDSSGNANNGTVTGAAYVNDQWGGQALDFDGDDYVSIPDPGGSRNLDGFSELTLEAWICPDTVTGHEAIISKYNNFGGKNTSYYLSRVGDEVRIYVRENATNRSYADTTGANLTAGTWYHVAGTWDGIALKLYVNCSLETSSTTTEGTFPATMLDTSEDVELGAFHKNASGNRFAYFNGKIDEVRIWDTATPSFNLDASPETAVNPVMTPHTVTATVTITRTDTGDEPAPGVKVYFDITGPNSAQSGTRYTNSSGVANISTPFTYTGSGVGGTDTINVWVDQDWSGDFNSANDAYDEVTKDWVVINFVTGGGKLSIQTATGIGSAKKPAYTFGGTVGYLPDMTLVGQFQIVDHQGKKSWHCHNLFSSLVFSGGTTTSPPATYNIATFIGTFYSNKGDMAILTIEIVDNAEPGKGSDTIWISGWFIPDTPKTLDGGNFQAHDGYKSP